MSVSATMIAWFLLAINAWGSSPIPKAEQERVSQVRQRVAEAMFSVAYDPDEPSIYTRDERHGRAHMGILLVRIAALESGFDELLIAGKCKPHRCDNGKATGMMQIHTGEWGIRLVGDKARRCEKKDFFDQVAVGTVCLQPKELVKDEETQIRMGLHILRTQGLSGYLGEGTEEGEVSALRRIPANRWMIEHPAPVTDSEVLSDYLAQE